MIYENDISSSLNIFRGLLKSKSGMLDRYKNASEVIYRMTNKAYQGLHKVWNLRINFKI